MWEWYLHVISALWLNCLRRQFAPFHFFFLHIFVYLYLFIFFVFLSLFLFIFYLCTFLSLHLLLLLSFCLFVFLSFSFLSLYLSIPSSFYICTLLSIIYTIKDYQNQGEQRLIFAEENQSIIYYFIKWKSGRAKADFVGGISIYYLLFQIMKIREGRGWFCQRNVNL